MPYLNHTRITAAGRLGDNGVVNAEIFSCSIAVVPTGGDPGYVDLDGTQQDNLIGAWNELWAASGAGIANTALLDTLKLANIGPDGKTVGSPIVIDMGGSSSGNSNPKKPGFCTVCVTLETGSLTGFARRGRMYLPNYALPANDTAISDATRDTLRDTFVTFLNKFSDSGIVPVVASQSSAQKVVTGVSVDGLYDTQRRRKNQLPTRRSAVADLG